MLERITRENALKDLHINLLRTKIVEMVDTTAVWQTLVTLCCAASFKAKKNPQKCRQKKKKNKKKTPQKQQYWPSPNKAKKAKKHLTIYSINIELDYSTKKYYLNI